MFLSGDHVPAKRAVIDLFDAAGFYRSTSAILSRVDACRSSGDPSPGITSCGSRVD